jgi:hypothetical protein
MYPLHRRPRGVARVVVVGLVEHVAPQADAADVVQRRPMHRNLTSRRTRMPSIWIVPPFDLVAAVREALPTLFQLRPTLLWRF